MSEVLLVEIEFNSKTWYLSEEGYIGENYYAPYLAETPTLELGQVKGGYIGVQLGNIVIANRESDRFSPFSIFGGGYAALLANTTQKIPVSIFWQQNKITESLFEGLMYLSEFNTDSFTFLLEDKIADVDLLSTARDINSTKAAIGSVSIRGEGNTAFVTAPDHGLEDGDLISVSGAFNQEFNTIDPDPDSNEIIDVEVEVIDDNFFRYSISSYSTETEYSQSYSIQTYTKKPQPFSFGVIDRKKDIIQTAEREREELGGYSGFEYSNPNLKIDDPDYPILLFDDGIFVGSSDTARSGNLVSGLVATNIFAEGDLCRIYTNTKTGLIPGSTVKITGFLPEEINTTGAYYPVIDVNDTITGLNSNFTLYLRYTGDEPIGLDPASTPTIYTPGEYFGPDRLPTEKTIFSRAYFNDLAPFNDSTKLPVTTFNGSGDNPVDLTSRDGSVILGTPLVSGVSSNGRTLSEFFEYIARKVGVSNVDFKDAPNASSLELQLWEVSQTKAIEYAGEIAYAANYLFEIKNDTLRVIDRLNSPSDYIRINNWDIIEASYKIPTPKKALRAKWTVNITNPRTIPTSLTTREESIMISNMESGDIEDITPVTENFEDQRSVLENIKQVISKTVISLTVGNIRSDIKVGSRILANRDEDGVSIDMIVRTISYEFKDLQTKVEGDGTVTVIEQDQVY